MTEKLMDIKELEELMKDKGISRFDAKDGDSVVMLDVPKRIIDKENGLVLYNVFVRPVANTETREMGDVKYVILDEQTVVGMKEQIESDEKLKESIIGYA